MGSCELHSAPSLPSVGSYAFPLSDPTPSLCRIPRSPSVGSHAPLIFPRRALRQFNNGVEAAVGALTDPSANEALQLTLLESGGAHQLHQPTQPPQSPQQPSGTPPFSTCNVGGNQGGGAGSSRVLSDATASAAADPGGSNLEVTAGAGGGGGEVGRRGLLRLPPS